MDFHSSFRFVLTHHAMSLVVRPSVAVVKSPFVATEQTSSPFRLSATAVTAARHSFLPFSEFHLVRPS